MPALALADYLQDFGARTRPSERGGIADLLQMVPQVETPPPPAPIDVESIIAEEIAAAIAKTEASVTERVSRIYEDTLQAERDHHAAEIAALRAELGAQAGAAITARVAEMEARVTELTTSTVARILGARLNEDVERRTVASLARAVSDAIADGEAVRIKVRGPQAIFEALRAELGNLAANLDYAEADGFDLSVQIDGSLFETRLSEWSAALSEAFS